MVFNDYTSTSRRIVGNLQLDSTVILYILFCSLSLLLLPLKEMLFREGREGFIHVVMLFASSEDVGNLYLVLPPHKVSLWN